MWRYALSRLLVAVATVLVAAAATFVMVRLAPGDPLQILIGEYATRRADRGGAGGLRPGPAGLGNSSRSTSGRPSASISANSIVQGIPVAELVLWRMPATLLLATATMALIILSSVPLGILSAVRQGQPADRLASGGAFVALSLPDFWVGVVLILVFARWLHLLPSGGMGGAGSLILPAVTLALPLAALNLRLMRNETLNVLSAPYVTLARSRGLPARTILCAATFCATQSSPS